MENVFLLPVQRQSAAGDASTRIRDLQKALMPTTQAVVGGRLKVLFAAFPSRDLGKSERQRALAYFYALDGVAEAVLDAAIRDVLTGEAAEISRAFLPTPPQLAHLCRQKAAAIQGELWRLEGAMKPQAPRPEPRREPRS